MGYVENAQRVKVASDNIKNAIISKGVTPTGNLESFADAINSISVPNVAAGTFVAKTAGVEIELGFEPTRIIIYVNPENNTYNEAVIWDISGILRKVRAAGNNAGGISTGGIAVNGTKFTHNTYNDSFANKTAYYIAIG